MEVVQNEKTLDALKILLYLISNEESGDKRMVYLNLSLSLLKCLEEYQGDDMNVYSCSCDMAKGIGTTNLLQLNDDDYVEENEDKWDSSLDVDNILGGVVDGAGGECDVNVIIDLSKI
jgi:hypothetical protein